MPKVASIRPILIYYNSNVKFYNNHCDTLTTQNNRRAAENGQIGHARSKFAPRTTQSDYFLMRGGLILDHQRHKLLLCRLILLLRGIYAEHFKARNKPRVVRAKDFSVLEELFN
jgi:hypothetical protein